MRCSFWKSDPLNVTQLRRLVMQQIMQAQDQNVDGLLTSVQGLNHVAVQINHEVRDQNKFVKSWTLSVVKARADRDRW